MASRRRAWRPSFRAIIAEAGSQYGAMGEIDLYGLGRRYPRRRIPLRDGPKNPTGAGNPIPEEYRLNYPKRGMFFPGTLELCANHKRL